MDDTVYALKDISMNGEKAVDKGDEGVVLGAPTRAEQHDTRVRVRWNRSTGHVVGNVAVTVISVSDPKAGLFTIHAKSSRRPHSVDSVSFNFLRSAYPLEGSVSEEV